MFLLFTDFGWAGPYVGQMKARLAAAGVRAPVVDLMHDVPPFQVRPAAYLLAALWAQERAPACWLTVVDPGVGSARRALLVAADGHWFAGPDNGLLALVVRRARQVAAYALPVPAGASPSFHGRDVFAPALAWAACEGRPPAGAEPVDPTSVDRPEWPDDWGAVIYVDRYGNAMTGLRAAGVSRARRLRVGGRQIAWARTFSEVPPGTPFWYENSQGLVEVAVNQGRADRLLGLQVGAPLAFEED